MSGAADWIRILAIVIFTLVAAIIDVRTRRLPNWLTVSAFVAALVFHLSNGAINDGFSGAFYGLLNSLGGFATGFSILFVLWLIGGGGAGDAKLMGAVGAWLGAKYTLWAFFLSVCFAILGSVFMVLLMVGQNGLSQVKRRYFNKQSGKNKLDEMRQIQKSSKRRIMTYALPVALGTWLVLVWQVVGHKH